MVQLESEVNNNNGVNGINRKSEQFLNKEINEKSPDQQLSSNGKIEDSSKLLQLTTINPHILNFKQMEYAARGPVILRTMEIEKEMLKGIKKPFNQIIKANLGDAQAMGQGPITWLRQILSLVTYPILLESTEFQFPEDAKQRAREILSYCRGGSIGSYSESRGMEIIRKHVAEFIERRDNGISSSPNDIIVTAGASDGIRSCIKLLKDDGTDESKRSGVLTPIPEYPLYNSTLQEYNMAQVGYYLDEDKGWSLLIPELERCVKEAREVCNPRAIVVINPSNPTGHVLSRENIEDVIRFAHKENLIILADEVYQDNVYGDAEFHSFRKVLLEMESPYNSKELMSFFSCSKGLFGECGLRGGYVELTNINSKVKDILIASIAAKLCPTIHGQIAVECIVNPPKTGEISFPLYNEEKSRVISSLAEKADFLYKELNSIPGIVCAEIKGAMYAYPKLILPDKAIQEAEKRGLGPDVFYALELVEQTGISVVPGFGVGNFPGTYHFRTTILPSLDQIKEMMERLKLFQTEFLNKYN